MEHKIRQLRNKALAELKATTNKKGARASQLRGIIGAHSTTLIIMGQQSK